MDTTILTQFTNTHCDDVNRICYPLFKKTPVNFFVYERFYDNADALFLSSTSNVLINWAVDELHPTRAELDLYSSFGLKMAYFSHHMPLPLGSEVAAEKYEKVVAVAADSRLFHILFFISRESDYYKVCGFGSEKSSKPILNFYINSAIFLEKFILYFENFASELIYDGNNDGLIMLPTYNSPLPVSDNLECYKEYNHIENVFETQSKSDIKTTSQLTLREEQCLALIAQGYTMKSVAIKLNISHRTVEQHLRNIKDKYGLCTKNQLVELWHDQGGGWV
ncbi:MAG: helix-turn-helix transcriptional regulator [Gammaproteobacteria bacterium]|nr:helix-turn-helix transcriptional regulator [Gammaproteobacteria bacterium]